MVARPHSPVCLQTGYEQHVREGGCSSSGKEGDEQERLQRLGQLVRVCLLGSCFCLIAVACSRSHHLSWSGCVAWASR